jgi:hypothetical protein
MQQGEAVQMVVKVVDSDGFEMDSLVTFTSKDTGIVVMGPTAVAHSRGRAGQTEIVVSAAGLTRTIQATVRGKLAAVQLFPSPSILQQLDSVQITARAIDQSGVVMPSTISEFTVGDSTVATISSTGMLRSLGPVGPVSVFAKASFTNGEYIGGTTFEIVPVADRILAPQTLEIGEGTSGVIDATVLDRLGDALPDASITFTTLNQSLIRTTAAGVVYSLAGQGATSVRVTSGPASVNVATTVVPFTTSAWNLTASIPAPGAFALASSASGLFVTSSPQNVPTRGSWSDAAPPFALAAGPSGHGVAADSRFETAYFTSPGTREVVALSIANGQILWRLSFSDLAPMDVLVDHGDTALYLAGDFGVVRSVDTRSRATRWSTVLDHAASRLRRHPSQPWLLVMGEGSVTIVDHQSGAIVRRLATPAIQHADFSPDGTELYVLRGRTLHMLNPVDERELRKVRLKCDPYEFIFSAGGDEVFATCPYGFSAASELLVIDAAAARIRKRVPLRGLSHKVSRPSSRILLVSSLSGWVDVVR